MNEIKTVAIVPDQPIGWLETHLPKSVMSRLQNYIEVAKKNPTNVKATLAGNISKSLSIEDKDNWFFETILIPLIGNACCSLQSVGIFTHITKENTPL